MPKANNRNIYEERPWLNDDVQNRTVLRQIVGGGSDITVEEVTFTDNGDYTAPEGKAYSPVHVNVAGGSSDFSTAEVTIIDPDECLEHFIGPCVENNEARTNFSGDPSEGIPVILYKGAAQVELTVTDAATIEITGSVTTEAGSYIVAGDCTFTITAN